MVSRRRMLRLGCAGVTGALGGCVARITGEAVGIQVGTSSRDAQTLEIEISPGYEEDALYAETITIDDGRSPIERERAITGRNGDRFYVTVDQRTIDETFEEYWTLSCVGDDDIDDLLSITVAEWGEVRFGHHQCSRNGWFF